MTTPADVLRDSAAPRTAALTAELACRRIETAWRCLDDAYGPDERAKEASDAMRLARNHLHRVVEILSRRRSGHRRRVTVLLAAVAVAVVTQLPSIPVPTAVVIGAGAGAGTAALIHQAGRAWHRYRLAAIPTTGPYRPAVRYQPGCVGWIKNRIGSSHRELHAVIELTDRLCLVLPTSPYRGPVVPAIDHLYAAGRHAAAATYWLAAAAERVDEHLAYARSL
ncbi:hypothetical protein [Micromonospora sp. HM5-17]|uniref:hypothetical protein n=1 Tax=Micromonospora sp. HM5-17 TaxID=2487710 RepID=UPI000F460B56|nr:hypothetical protein [Micromonospora sp. HM5-17]ROT33505.1 hypothetical protein EF879_00575 [Micromonospora sp. HM5-17]